MLKNLKQVSSNVAKKASSKVADKAQNLHSPKLTKKPKIEADNQGNYLVALDIGTEYVKALIGQINPDETIDIVGVGRRHQGLSDMQAGAISDIAAVVENCDQALSMAENMAGISARNAVIGIAGELVKGMTLSIRVIRKEPEQAIDALEMEKIIRLVQDRAEAKASEELALELGGKDVSIRLVNSALVSLEIDGYPVTNPIGFQGKNVVVEMYTAFAPMIHIGALERTAKELDLDLLAVAAEPFAVSRAVIGNRDNQNLNAILMDVGGGTTDIAVIDQGGLQGTKMFGIGGRAFSHAIARELVVDYNVAEEYKIAYSDQQLPPQKLAAVESALDKTADVWLNGIELALAEFDKLDHLPHRMFLCGGGASLAMLLDRLQGNEWYRDLALGRQPTVNLIKPSQVDGIVDVTNKINDHTYITAMGLLRVGLDTLQFNGNDQPTSMREKLDKMLRN